MAWLEFGAQRAIAILVSQQSDINDLSALLLNSGLRLRSRVWSLRPYSSPLCSAHSGAHAAPLQSILITWVMELLQKANLNRLDVLQLL